MKPRRSACAWAFAIVAILSAPMAGVVQAQPAQGARAKTDGFHTAQSLYENCKGSSVHGREYCFAYIAAVADSVRAYQAWLNLQDVCVQKTTSHGALADIFVAYVERNTALGQNQAASVVVLSMQERYPCTSKNPAAVPAG